MVTFRLFSLVFFTLVLSVFFVAAKKYRVPVLIWGPDYDVLKGKDFPVLKPISSEDFFNHVLKNIHRENSKSAVVLFIEETISTEDFSSRALKYETAFPKLENIASKNNFEFLRSVENPVITLTSADLKSYGFTFSELSENDLDGVNLKPGVIYTINLEDADSKEDRPEMLHRHDGKIADIYNKLVKSNNNLVAILTGRYSSWTEPEEVIRVRRQANETARNDSNASKPAQPVEASSGIVLDTKSALIYTKKPPVLKIDDKEVTLPSASGVNDVREKLQRAIFSFATELGRFKLRFRFENSTSNAYWSLSQIELDTPQGLVLLTTKRQISAPYDLSFHTSTPVQFSNNTMSLTFSDIQVQPWTTSSELNRQFGPAEDDATFFTAPIWTGLIVVTIISIILAWALTMIMDIRTMDQFDDPKGKTITVNVVD